MPIQASTKIIFPGGAINGKSKILMMAKVPFQVKNTAIFVEETPFHPLDNNWPDQPSDKGKLVVKKAILPVNLCLTAAMHRETKQFLFDKEIQAKKDNPEWFFLVAHLVDSDKIEDIGDILGEEISLEVDKDYRHALSVAHTSCHLAALALNFATARFWKKPVPQLDSLGNPDIDKLAVVESKIDQERSLDRYHIGKSLKKKGFNLLQFLEHLDQVNASMNQQLASWSKGPLHISVKPSVSFLHDRRQWVCRFPSGQEAILFCGGTHILGVPQAYQLASVLQFDKEGSDDFSMEVKSSADNLELLIEEN